MRAALAASAGERFKIGPGALPEEAVSVQEPVIAVALPVRDTCKEVVDGIVRRTVPRESLVEVTGPWLVTRSALEQALQRSGSRGQAPGLLELFREAGLAIRVLAHR